MGSGAAPWSRQLIHPPSPTLNTEARAARHWGYSRWPDLAGDRTHSLPVPGWTLNRCTTELVYCKDRSKRRPQAVCQLYILEAPPWNCPLPCDWPAAPWAQVVFFCTCFVRCHANDATKTFSRAEKVCFSLSGPFKDIKTCITVSASLLSSDTTQVPELNTSEGPIAHP